MAEKIRLIKLEDLESLAKLYDYKKSVPELKWVLQNPNDLDKFNGYIAEKDNAEVIGMIGFEVGVYKHNEKEYKVAIPMSWKIADNYKGFVGIQLLNKVLSLGDFGMTIAGSEVAQRVYPSLNLVKIGSANTFIKLLNPIKYFISLKETGRPLYKRIGKSVIAFPSILKGVRCSTNLLDIVEIKKNADITDVPYLHKDFFEKVITKKYLTWLSSCPLHDTYIFKISNKERLLGYSVCFIQKSAPMPPRGRIVYIPNLEKEASMELISFLISFLKNKECCSVRILGLDSNLKNTLFDLGFVNCKRKQKPIYIRGSKKLPSIININNWYMQYTEGDKAYRDL